MVIFGKYNLYFKIYLKYFIQLLFNKTICNNKK